MRRLPSKAGRSGCATGERGSRCAAIEVLEGRRLLSVTGGISGKLLEVPTFMSPPAGPLVGWQVFVDLNRNGYADRREPTATSDTSGRYRFDGLQPGRYRVATAYLPGWVPADGTNRKWEVVRVRSGQTTEPINFVAARVLGGVIATISAVQPRVLAAGSTARVTLRLENSDVSATVRGLFDVSLFASPASSASDSVTLAHFARKLRILTGRTGVLGLTFVVPKNLPSRSYTLLATILPHGAPAADAIATPAFGPVAVR